MSGTGLKIGPLALEVPVVLAPMAGVTNAAFRRLCCSFGAGMYVSEMITARALLEGNERTLSMLPGPYDAVRSVQLYGVDPTVIGGAVATLVDDHGVDHVDLNFGCPAPKVTRKGGGAALPLRPVLFRNVVRAAVAAAGTVPVTVKMRIGLDQGHRSYLTAARLAVDEGAAAITLHARTAEAHYAGPADWSAIAELKAAIDGVPVLGNGDIWEAADALRMMAVTGCDGVVVGRGCLGRPWLFADLADAFAGRTVAAPRTLGAALDVLMVHAALLIDEFGPDRGIRQLRKHIGWYLTGYPVGGARRAALAQVASLDELRAGVADLDRSLPLPDSARRQPRGHTNGPVAVALPPGWLDHPDDPTPPSGADALVAGG